MHIVFVFTMFTGENITEACKHSRGMHMYLTFGFLDSLWSPHSICLNIAMHGVLLESHLP